MKYRKIERNDRNRKERERHGNGAGTDGDKRAWGTGLNVWQKYFTS